MGVLGWGYDQTMDAPMQAIERALKSRHKLISDVLRVFTGGELAADEATISSRQMSPALFDALFSKPQ